MSLSRSLGAYSAFRLIQLLTVDWKETDAFKLGIIDETGKVLKKSRDLKTSEEKDAYTFFHRIAWNLKRMLEALPGGSSKIKSYAAAAWLLKENKDTLLKEIVREVEPDEIKEARKIIEDMAGVGSAPTNTAASVPTKDNPLALARRKKKKDEEKKSMGKIKDLQEAIEEGRFLKRVVRQGVAMKKVKCGPGQIVKDGKCVTKTSQDKQRLRKASIKRNRSMAGKSRATANRLRKKSNRKRSSIGLNSSIEYANINYIEE